jgi:secreted trypsin-like serine protease
MVRNQRGGFPFESRIADILFWIFISMIIIGIVLLSLWLTGKSSSPKSALNLTSAIKNGNMVDVAYKTSEECSDCDISFQLTYDGGSTDTVRSKYISNTTSKYSLHVPVVPDMKNLKVVAFIEDNTSSTNTDAVTIDVTQPSSHKSS